MSITENGLNVRIAWSAPDANSEAIIDYQILILKSDGVTWVEDTTDCLGTAPTVISNLYCDVPYTVLRTNYGLPYNALVFAKVRARNANGYSDYSE